MANNEDNSKRKRVTLLEIAQAANVSKSTVSLVLNNSPNAIPISEATRQSVLETAKMLGYRPNAAAKALATGRSNTVLMVAFDLWDENLAERLRGTEAFLVPAGYSVRMCTMDSAIGFGAYTELLRSGQADGVLLTGISTPDTYPMLRDLAQEAKEEGIPVVALADAFPRECVEIVADIEDQKGAEDAVRHLIEHGHRTIVLLGVKDQRWAVNREKGYRAALDGAGIPVDPSLVVLGDRSQTWAYNTTLELCKSLKFTAMFVVTDNMAVAAMSALHVSGRKVPDDCAIIGFDNNEKMAKYTDPPLTTVDNPFYDTGRQAAEMLIDMIEDRPLKRKPLPASLVIRQSCGCNPR